MLIILGCFDPQKPDVMANHNVTHEDVYVVTRIMRARTHAVPVRPTVEGTHVLLIEPVPSYVHDDDRTQTLIDRCL